MALYLSIIFVTGNVAALCNSLWAQNYLGANALEIIYITWLAIIISFLIDALCAFMIRQIPERKINEKSNFFKVRKWEKKVFSFLKVKKWKDNIPELGGMLKFFDKSSVKENVDSKYMMKFIKETCYAEIMHIVSLFFAPLVIIILPRNFLLTIVLPVMIVNIFLQIPPILVQRLNRPKLEMAYKRLKRNEEAAEISA